MVSNRKLHVTRAVATLKHSPRPARRELRVQAMHRLQVGLFGLCAILLIIGLANVIMDRARLTEAEDPPVAQETRPKKSETPVSDPLADIGVVPAADPSKALRASSAAR